ncbi:MAG TPA: hypothetical protein PKE21_17280 [Flavobacteriales bacterium]|nr:hypothetical protein [Flavobacteriales bacterium]HMR29233.1 hypothetical protein [Flavobacteriales bacterium]
MKAADLFLDYRFILALTHALLSVGASHGQTVRDRFGASYTRQDIRLPEAGSFRGSGGSCQVGIFNLIFENWGPVGFNDPVDGPQRQAAACQVFSDLSELIEAAPNPYPLPRPSAFVNVRINQTFLPVLNQVGRGTPLYNFITIPDGDANPFNDFTPQVLREGVLDGEAWRTINGGFDAWYASTQCFPDEGNFAHYHADIQIDFDQFTFHELPAAPPLGVLDLYTVIAHEAMHCLGFLSHTAEPSPGIFGSWWDPSAVFFSRYDLGLYPNSLPFINNHLLCTAWGGNYAASADLEDPCNVFFDGPTTSPLEVYAPLSFGGSSMEHLDATCPGATPYLMHPGNVAGQSRIPTQDEANVLCDIDYHVNDHHGDLWSGWVDTYASRLECGSRLAGVDDIFSDYGTLAPYVYKQGQLGPLLIDNFLDNDEDQMVGGGIPTEHTCLTIIRGGGVITNALSASFEYTPDPGFAGLAILRYEPLNSGSNRKGNLTYVFIEVWPPDICGIDPCNIVNGGDFELLPWEGQSMTGTSNNLLIG